MEITGFLGMRVMNWIQNCYKIFFPISPVLSKIPNSHKESTTSLLLFSHLPIDEVFQHLETDGHPLSEEESANRLKQYGLNEIAHDRPPSWPFLLLRNFTNPFIALLLILAIISFFLGDIDAVIIITIMVFISVGIRFTQEFKSNRAAEKLKALVSTKATVLRSQGDGKEPKKEEVDIKVLVPGDIICLSAGDMLPADVRLVSAKGLYVSQAALTGESLPIEKDESLKAEEGDNPLEMPNMCYMGTNVLNGVATAIVVKTGNQTFFGSMAKSIIGHRPLTSFDIGVNKVSWLLIQFMLVMVPIVFFLNGFTKGDWLQALLSLFPWRWD